MSSTFFNKNSKLSSNEMTKRKALLENIFIKNNNSCYSINNNKKNDYNTLISNKLILNEIINLKNNNIILNTNGEIYIGNYLVKNNKNNNSKCTSLSENYDISYINFKDFNYKSLCMYNA